MHVNVSLDAYRRTGEELFIRKANSLRNLRGAGAADHNPVRATSVLRTPVGT